MQSEVKSRKGGKSLRPVCNICYVEILYWKVDKKIQKNNVPYISSVMTRETVPNRGSSTYFLLFSLACEIFQ